MFTMKFWKDAGERAVRAFASTLLSLLGIGTMFLGIHWAAFLAAGGGAAAVSLLTSIVGSVATNDPTTASLVNKPGS